MTVQHVADPAQGAREFAINAGMERDGVSARVCLHPDRTVRWDAEQHVRTVECDYCPVVAVVRDRVLHVELAAWCWRAP